MRVYHCVAIAAIAVSTGVSGVMPSAAHADPAALVAKADAIRNPSNSYKMVVKVRSRDPGSESTFEVFLRGTTRTLIVTREPKKDRGRNMLMLDRDFYAYIPNLKRSMRLSLAQKLSGQVANGDIARTRWAGDYEVKLENESSTETQLLLDGRKPNLTYQKIRLWLAHGDARPLRAEYLSLDGKTLLKRAWFESYKILAAASRPSVIRIEDTNQQTSSIEIESMTPTDLADSFFTEQNMESHQ